MIEVDVHLVTAWGDRLFDAARPVMRHWGVRPTDEERTALGAGFAAIRIAVLGEHPPGGALNERAGRQPSAATDLERYLRGVAAGIEATGADRDPMSLVAGLVAGAARLQFDRAGRGGEEPSAAEAAARAGVAAADVATEGAPLARVTDVAAAVAAEGWAFGVPDDPELVDDYRLRALIGMVLAALNDVVSAMQDGPQVAGCGATAGDHRGRTFLAEVTFEFRGAAAAQARLADSIGLMGTDLRVWPGSGDDGITHYHLHTNHPAEVVGEIYAMGTPFDLLIGSLEPPMSERSGRIDAGSGHSRPDGSKTGEQGRADINGSQ